MYSKKEASLVRKKFWTSFGQYMKPILNASGETINWLNYKTGIKDIYFRMDAGSISSSIAIELRHTDPIRRKQVYDRLFACKQILEDITGSNWEWQGDYYDEDGNTISRIYQELANVNIFQESDWPAIISFLKPRLIGLNEFWLQVKDLMEA